MKKINLIITIFLASLLSSVALATDVATNNTGEPVTTGQSTGSLTGQCLLENLRESGESLEHCSHRIAQQDPNAPLLPDNLMATELLAPLSPGTVEGHYEATFTIHLDETTQALLNTYRDRYGRRDRDGEWVNLQFFHSHGNGGEDLVWNHRFELPHDKSDADALLAALGGLPGSLWHADRAYMDIECPLVQGRVSCPQIEEGQLEWQSAPYRRYVRQYIPGGVGYTLGEVQKIEFRPNLDWVEGQISHLPTDQRAFADATLTTRSIRYVCADHGSRPRCNQRGLNQLRREQSDRERQNQ